MALILAMMYESTNPTSFWKPYFDILLSFLCTIHFPTYLLNFPTRPPKDLRHPIILDGGGTERARGYCCIGCVSD